MKYIKYKCCILVVQKHHPGHLLLRVTVCLCDEDDRTIPAAVFQPSSSVWDRHTHRSADLCSWQQGGAVGPPGPYSEGNVGLGQTFPLNPQLRSSDWLNSCFQVILPGGVSYAEVGGASAVSKVCIVELGRASNHPEAWLLLWEDGVSIHPVHRESHESLTIDLGMLSHHGNSLSYEYASVCCFVQ